MINYLFECARGNRWALLVPAFCVLQVISPLPMVADDLATAESKEDLAPAGTLSADWKPLFDAKLSNWELWMGVPHKTVIGLPPGTPLSDDGHKGTPLGLNNDPLHVFSVSTDSGEPILRITGQIFGGLTTLKSYSNYHFRVQVRWGEIKWEPKLRVKRDSGLLYDCTGPHGAFWNVWKRCLEFQVEEKNMGDLYCLSGTRAVTNVLPDPSDPHKSTYDPAGSVEIVERLPHLPGDFEVPNGQWNALDLYTIGQTSVAVVNGHVVMVVRDIMANVDNEWVPLRAGQIQLQSEGSECEYRQAEIQSLKAYPPEIQQLAQFTAAELGKH